jgi:hypothetical protein
LGVRFCFGCRVGGVYDQLRSVQGRRVRVWGWNYRTVQGHLERGRVDDEVWKWLGSGAVEFCGQPTPPWPGQPTVAPAADQTRTQRRLAQQQPDGP